MDKFEAIYQLVKIWNSRKISLEACTRDFFKENTQFSHSEMSFIESLVSHQIKFFIYLKFFQEFLDKHEVFPSDFTDKYREIFVLLIHHKSLPEAEELVKIHLPQFASDFNQLYLKTQYNFKKFESDIKKRTNFKKQLYVLKSYSRQLIDLWTSQFNDSYLEFLMDGLNQKAEISIRVNNSKYTRKEVRALLEEQNIFTSPSPLSSRVLYVKNLGIYELLHSQAYKDGLFMLMDEGEVILNQLHRAENNQLIIDLFPYNAEFILSYALDSSYRSKIVTVLKDKHRVFDFVNKIKHLKVPQLDIQSVKSNMELMQNYKTKADVVFVRPKTSGFGRLKIHPDKKWNIEKKHIYKLADEQFNSLATAHELVKPGGFIIYISDTINLIENEKLINKFMLSHQKYALVRDYELDPNSLNKFIQADKTIFFHPAKVPFSSFYVAKLKRL
ncbi:MAG: hypothetical protein Kow00108_21860 [Calditrichia bacterium]